MKWLLRIVMVAIAAFVLWQVWQRVFVTDETRIRRQISTMVSATEKGDVLRLSDALPPTTAMTGAWTNPC